MNKSDLSDALAAKLGLTKSAAVDVIATLFDGESGIIAETLKAGGEVSLQGFGSFKRATRAARVATNPATGSKINVAAKSVAKFKAGKNLAQTVA